MTTITERKNFHALTDEEKKLFIESLVESKRKGIYDKYVVWHAQTMSIMTERNQERSGRNAAHGGPIFLPWHREYLRRFEKEVQKEVNTEFSLPYWKWEEEPDLFTSNLWQSVGGSGNVSKRIGRFTDGSFLGYEVTDGPFSFDNGWKTIEVNDYGNPALEEYKDIQEPLFDLPLDKYPRFKLARAFGRGSASIPTPRGVERILSIRTYDEFPYSRFSNGFRNSLEGWIPGGGCSSMHNAIHVWVMGHMSINSSPNDPIFFLNHCNVDRIWAQWQAKPENNNDFGYPADGTIKYPDGERIKGHNRSDIMIPWNKPIYGNPTLESVLDHKTMDYKYV